MQLKPPPAPVQLNPTSRDASIDAALDLFQSPYFFSRTLRVTLPKNAETILIRFEIENSSHGFSRDARVEVTRFGELTSADLSENKKSYVVKKTGFSKSDVSSRSEPFYEQVIIFGNTLSLGESSGKIHSADGDIAWNLQFGADSSFAKFDSFPKGLRFFTGQSGHCKTLISSQPVRGQIAMNGTELDLSQATVSLVEDAGKRRLLSQIRCQSTEWTDQNGHASPFLLDVFSGEAQLGTLVGSIKTPRFTTLVLQRGEESHVLNSTWNSLRTRSQFQLHSWHIESDSGALRTIVEIQSNPQSESVSRVFDTDQTPLIRRVNPHASAIVHLYRSSKLTHSFRTTKAFLERIDHHIE